MREITPGMKGLMNITSAFEIMFPARNIHVRLELIEPTCYLIAMNISH